MASRRKLYSEMILGFWDGREVFVIFGNFLSGALSLFGRFWSRDGGLATLNDS